MIDTVEIYSQNDLERDCGKKNFDDAALISIGNPHWFFKKPQVDEKIPKIFKKSFKKILRLEFFDLSNKTLTQPKKPKRIPGLRDVKSVIHYFERYKNDYKRIVIHCWGGVSRSTGMGILVLTLSKKMKKK